MLCGRLSVKGYSHLGDYVPLVLVSLFPTVDYFAFKGLAGA